MREIDVVVVVVIVFLFEGFLVPINIAVDGDFGSFRPN